MPNRRNNPSFNASALATARSIRSLNDEALSTLLRRVVFAIVLTRSFCDPIFLMSGADIGGSAIGFGALINAVVIAVALLLVLQRPPSPVCLPVSKWAPFLLVGAAATLYAPEFSTAARMFLAQVSYCALFAIPFFIFRSREDLPRFVLLIPASSIIPSLYAIVDIARGMSNLAEFRLQSTFSHPNIYSFYLVLLLGLALYARTSRALALSRTMRLIITSYIPVIILFNALTKTRSGRLASAGIYVYYAILFERRLLLGLLLAPILLVIDPSLGDRLVDLSQSEEIDDFRRLNEEVTVNSYAWRQVLWSSAMPLIEARPFFGDSLESFRLSTPAFFPLAPNASEISQTDAHNFYLQILFEMGFVRLLTLFWLFGAVTRQLLQGFRYNRCGISVVFCILIAYLLESYSDSMAYYLAFNWCFWFFIGTVCAWINLIAHDRCQGKSSHRSARKNRKPAYWGVGNAVPARRYRTAV